MESSLDFKSFFDAFNEIYQLPEIKHEIHVVSQFPCLLGHPVLNIFFLLRNNCIDPFLNKTVYLALAGGRVWKERVNPEYSCTAQRLPKWYQWEGNHANSTFYP